MAEMMRAIRKSSPGPDLTVEEVPVPSPVEHDVLVQIEAASCCGTDS